MIGIRVRSTQSTWTMKLTWGLIAAAAALGGYLSLRQQNLLLTCLSTTGYVQAQFDEGPSGLDADALGQFMASAIEEIPENVVSQQTYEIGDDVYTITQMADGSVNTRCGKGKKKRRKGRK